MYLGADCCGPVENIEVQKVSVDPRTYEAEVEVAWKPPSNLQERIRNVSYLLKWVSVSDSRAY